MPIEIDIAHVARLARLGLDPDAMARLADELGVILEHAARIQAIDTEGVTPTAHPLGVVNRFRDDGVGPSLDRDAVLSQAPSTEGEYVAVPAALEG